VRVVLDADEIEAEPVGELDLLEDRVPALGFGTREDAEEQLHRRVPGVVNRPAAARLGE
jgi:hypothetical protein